MWNSYLKFDRLAAALKSRGVNPEEMTLGDMMRVLSKRTTDRQLNRIVWELVVILEPPGCQMSHCKHFGNSAAPMNCGDGRTPGRCGILRAFKKRQEEREQKKALAAAERAAGEVAT